MLLILCAECCRQRADARITVQLTWCHLTERCGRHECADTRRIGLDRFLKERGQRATGSGSHRACRRRSHRRPEPAAGRGRCSTAGRRCSSAPARGSGKTRVLTRRIAWILTQFGAWPSQILAITFTNKAAAEMRERLTGLIGPVAQRMWVSTFHSACVRILRRDGEQIGLEIRILHLRHRRLRAPGQAHRRRSEHRPQTLHAPLHPGAHLRLQDNLQGWREQLNTYAGRLQTWARRATSSAGSATWRSCTRSSTPNTSTGSPWRTPWTSTT